MMIEAPYPSGIDGWRAPVWDDAGKVVGYLRRTNSAPHSPWWADAELQEHVGGAFTSDSTDFCVAVREFRGAVKRSEQ